MDAKHNAEKPPAEETVAQTTRLDKDHTKWWSVLALVVVLIAMILILSTIRPHSSIAQEKSAYPESPTSVADLQQTRNLSTPSKRLVGRWRDVDYNSELYFSPIESELRIGTYRIRNRIGKGGSFGQPTRIRILRENLSGTELFYKEYKNLSIKKLELEIGRDLTKSDIRCCVSMDGTTMTLEYTTGGDPDAMFSVYRYIDNEPLEK